MIDKDIIHLKGLNGIRAIAALSVLFAHLTGELYQFGLSDTFIGTDELGNRLPIFMASYGVTMFFALSGFLITYLLLIEKEKSGIINVKKFYIRRVLRIWPLYYFYGILVASVYILYQINYDNKMLPFYIFLMANIPLIIQNSLPMIGHLWSIGVEEQFYLFWPWFSKVKLKTLLLNSSLFILIFYVIKVVAWYFKIELLLSFLTVTRFNIMLIGCVGAILFFKKHSLINKLTDYKIQLLAWLIIILACFNMFHISSSLIDHEVIGFVTVVIIIAQVNRKNYIINLNNRVLDFIGKISYGIYVYHPLLIFLAAKNLESFKESKAINYIVLYIFIFISAILISYLSYRFIEKPFIKLKSNFQVAKSKA